MLNNSNPQEFFKNASPENKVMVSSLERRADDFAKASDIQNNVIVVANIHPLGTQAKLLATNLSA